MFETARINYILRLRMTHPDRGFSSLEEKKIGKKFLDQLVLEERKIEKENLHSQKKWPFLEEKGQFR